MNSETLHVENQSQPEESSHEDSLEFPQQEPEEYLTLPIIDRQFIEETPPSFLARYILTLLASDESIFMLFRLSTYHTFEGMSGKTAKVPLWTVITGTRLLLIAASEQGDTYSDSFDQHTVVEYQNGFSRDAIKIADRTLPTGVWEGKRWLFKEAVNLFPLPEYEKYLYLANMCLQKKQHREALPFLQSSLRLVPTIKASLLVTHILAQQGQQEEALNVLNQAFEISRASSLIEEIQRQFPDDVEMLLYLAAVSEDRHEWDTCIEIYHLLLQKTPDFDLYFLKLGEMYNARQEYQEALEHYQKFLELRQGSEKFQRGEYIQWDMTDFTWFSADPDLVKAYFDLGIIYEYELNDLEKAASTYLELLRHAPFYRDAYKHFWLVYQQLSGASPENSPDVQIAINLFLQIYKLLVPEHYTSIVEKGSSFVAKGSANEGFTRRPITYHRMFSPDREDLIHPGEREYWRRIQQWLTSLVISEDDSEGIEEFCEQVSSLNFPDLHQIILQLSDFLNIDPPKCFISRGKIGISVRKKEHPFIFIGSEHLNPENDRYFSHDELMFIIATQMEHIKSEHVLVTDTDLWKSFGTASFDSFLVALQCLPVGSFLGKITHQFATAGLKKVYKMTKHVSIQKILDFFHKKEERSGKDTPEVQEENGSYQWADKERSKSKKAQEPETLFKEQFVDFARHAVYTADRIGLLASNDFEAACSAIFKLSSNAYENMEQIRTEGLVHILGKRDNRGNFLYFEYARRFSELIRFALSENYARMQARLVVLPKEESLSDEPPQIKEASDEYHILLYKLQVLENSRQSTLLTQEEFLRKQKNLVAYSGLLHNDDMALIDKLQQAYLDNILTTEELHHKLFSLLEMRHGSD